MKTFIDHRKVRRRSLISNLVSVGGLLVLLSGVLIPFFIPKLVNAAQIWMFAGIGLSMIGIYYANRWVRKPRPEDSLDQVLKSHNDSYRIFHYPSLPCEHVLLTPFDVVIIEVFNLAGDFSYKDGRWKEKMNLGRALRYVVEEHLGDPVKNTRELEKYLRGRLTQVLGSEHPVPIHSVVTFTHPAARLDVKNSPVPVCKLDKLNRHILMKTARLDPAIYNKLDSFFQSLTMNSKTLIDKSNY
jgi:hypothetical protein